MHELTQPQLYAETQEVLEAELQDYTTYGFEGLEFSNDITIISVEEVIPENIGLKSLDSDEILINISGKIYIEANGFIDKHEYCSSLEHGERDLYVIDGDWNDHVMFVSQCIYTPFQVSLSYSKAGQEITGHSIELPEEIVDDFY